jgi:two-component system sensor histidine kinase DesK
VLTVTDDGAGPGERVPLLGGSPGSGLAGLRERVAALGGELRTGRATGGGFQLRAQVPLVPSSVPLARS